MPSSIFDVDALRAALGRLDAAEVARRTVELAEDNMPGCAWLDSSGDVQFAETMSEVGGLVLCQAHEPDDDDELDDCLWVAGWVREIGLVQVAEQLELELTQVLTALR
ncbi:MAG: hypothetical protein KF743_12320 [Fimbriimonadaceae bacterium]|nr:hypothetical protein [Fimbriimonadaceae bacterium]